MRCSLAAALRRAGDEVRWFVQGYFNVPDGEAGDLAGALARRGYGQADVVLALLRRGYSAVVEDLVGKPVQPLPPDPRLSPKPYPKLPAPQPRVRSLKDNPFNPSSKRGTAFSRLRSGMTLEQVAARGMDARAVRLAVRAGAMVVR